MFLHKAFFNAKESFFSMLVSSKQFFLTSGIKINYRNIKDLSVKPKCKCMRKENGIQINFHKKKDF
jgi:hypothetical protein